jgi:hypothetical protein
MIPVEWLPVIGIFAGGLFSLLGGIFAQWYSLNAQRSLRAMDREVRRTERREAIVEEALVKLLDAIEGVMDASFYHVGQAGLLNYMPIYEHQEGIGSTFARLRFMALTYRITRPDVAIAAGKFIAASTALERNRDPAKTAELGTKLTDTAFALQMAISLALHAGEGAEAPEFLEVLGKELSRPGPPSAPAEPPHAAAPAEEG